MYKWISRKLFGTDNDRTLKRIAPLVSAVNALEPRVQALTDAQLRGKTAEFKDKLAQGASLDDLLPEAFAVVREASRRTTRMRHFDVQLVGGAVLHQGKIAEMKTGEGKTLVATLPAYLNALSGQGVHIVTVNDYLAKRDTEWMGAIYRFLGLTVGTIQHDLGDAERYAAYRADITYGTNNEFGFDYLRDNMKFRLADLAQREFNFAIVDEVDSILIDEARTPLIISGPTNESTQLFTRVDSLVRRFQRDRHFTIDEKSRTVSIQDAGVAEAERVLGVANLYDMANMDLVHAINTSLKAHHLFKLDVDYMVQDGKIVIVDEFTGRLMPGRRYSDGLHQALEAKERVKVEEEYQTLASVTFQNYFRMYKKLAGMTGTAATEATEFRHIYGLDVVEIPTNRTLIRLENPDVVYRTGEEKWAAVVEEIVELSQKGRPVLVGTISIEKSEHLSTLLRRKNVKHVVLNAKYHEQEAQIIAQAGRVGAVTIATNMAGRGVDILLGGNPEYLAREQLKKAGVDPAQAAPEQMDKALAEVKAVTEKEHEAVIALEGLHVLGTERHEARRIDNQLRGRAGRQGDPGSSRFYLSLEDDLMRIFGSERISGLMARIGMGDGVPIEHNMITRAIERAQKQVEGQNFTVRKHLLEYDDVMNKQRETIYGQRRKILHGEDQREYFLGLVDNLVDWMLDTHANKEASPEDWDREGLRQAVMAQFGLDIETLSIPWDTVVHEGLREALVKGLVAVFEAKEKQLGPFMRDFERMILLQVIDSQWKDHLLEMDHLKEGIGLRGYGQKDPLIEYKKEGFEMFQSMLDRIEEDAVRYLFLIQPVADQPAPVRRQAPVYYQKPQGPSGQRSKQARAMIPGKRHKH
ncbi:MAG: preprotein translocase subunit SecA [Candidatus Aminicenantes bacterium]|nr:preprotein translocase subunit SecA [Candidatus Aminicenantes bacterium]NLH76372.1 preprotein translocase subunit SecA [Acidobacteriota bacterium]